MNEQPLRGLESAQSTPLIELDNVWRTFVTGSDVRVDALRGVSLSIHAGEFLAIMGASGSGKTTLMNILGCLDRPSEGTYRYGGRDVSALDADALAQLRREAFGFVFQSYNLLPTATAEENVEIPAVYAGVSYEERKKRADELLIKLGVGDRLEHRPSQLSGGQQQRVSIARALMNGGEVILADEPTGALDSKSGEEVIVLLEELATQGHTVILITHDAKVAAHAHRIVELRDGEVVADSGSKTTAATRGVALREVVDETPSLFAGLGESLNMALRALRANFFRTMLTLLGIVIGVGSVVAMLAMGEGAKQRVVDQISSMGTNLIMIRPLRGRDAGDRVLLTPEDAEAIGELPNVVTSMPDVSGEYNVRYSNIDYRPEDIIATTTDLPFTRNWDLAQGAFFTRQDMEDYAPVAVLGDLVYHTLFPDGGNPIGEYFLVGNAPFQVIGVMEPKGALSANDDADDVVFVPLTTGMMRLFGQRHLGAITVAVNDISAMEETQDDIMDLLRARHDGAADFRIRNMADLLETVTTTQNTLTTFLAAVAAISLLVGGIGIMNIMLVSVTERTREIGIRMATGARQRDILQQFLSEAIMVSAIGGIVGIIGGVAVALTIRTFGTPILFTAMPMILAFSCAAATGLVFGYAPARKAARLDPVVALASE